MALLNPTPPPFRKNQPMSYGLPDPDMPLPDRIKALTQMLKLERQRYDYYLANQRQPSN